MKHPAILFAANPVVLDESKLGDVEAHIKFINQTNLESVNWNLIRMFRKTSPLLDFYNSIKKGYIYNVPAKSVNYTCDVNWIKMGTDITKYDRKFYPEWRRNDLPKDWIVLNLSNFNKLKVENQLKCSDFKLYDNGKNIARDYVRNYVIVEEY